MAHYKHPNDTHGSYLWKWHDPNKRNILNSSDVASIQHSNVEYSFISSMPFWNCWINSVPITQVAASYYTKQWWEDNGWKNPKIFMAFIAYPTETSVGALLSVGGLLRDGNLKGWIPFITTQWKKHLILVYIILVYRQKKMKIATITSLEVYQKFDMQGHFYQKFINPYHPGLLLCTKHMTKQL